MLPWPRTGPGRARCHRERRACDSRFPACTLVARERRGTGSSICIRTRRPGPDVPQTPPALPHPEKSGVRRIGGRDNHWSIKSVGRTRPHNILLMEPVSNPSCLVWQLGRGRPPGLSLVNQNNPYLTEREVRATEAQTSQVVRCTVHKTTRAAYPQNRHGTLQRDLRVCCCYIRAICRWRPCAPSRGPCCNDL